MNPDDRDPAAATAAAHPKPEIRARTLASRPLACRSWRPQTPLRRPDPLPLPRPRDDGRTVPARRRDRSRRVRRRVRGRATGTGAPPGGVEDHQARYGHPDGDRPLRAGATGPGADGPPPHRQGPGRRQHRLRTSLLRDGAGRGPAHHRVRRQAPSHCPAAPGALRTGLQRHPARHSKGIIHRDIKPSNVSSRATTGCRSRG